MIGALFGRKSHFHKYQYIGVALVTSGILIFNFMKTKTGGDDSLYGIFLLGVALSMDGVNAYCTETARSTF